LLSRGHHHLGTSVLVEKKRTMAPPIPLAVVLLLLLPLVVVGPAAPHPCVTNGVVARASCFGFDPRDSTSFLQAALSSNASMVIVDKQPSPWIVTPLVITSDNIHVHFADGVLVLAKAGNFTGSGDGLVTINKRRNVTLSGGKNSTLQMRRTDYQDPSKYKHSEFRMGLWLIDSVDVTISSLTIADTGD
jgi:hypothetical protein